jgi:hypothetical protein
MVSHTVLCTSSFCKECAPLWSDVSDSYSCSLNTATQLNGLQICQWKYIIDPKVKMLICKNVIFQKSVILLLPNKK